MENNNRTLVKYYTPTDMGIGIMLEASETILKSYDPNKEYEDVNDVIELFNTQRLINSGVTLKTWDKETVTHYKEICSLFSASIGRFCSKICDANLLSTYQAVIFNYKDDFWIIVSTYKVYKRISSDIIESMLDRDVPLSLFLQNNDLVDYYDTVVARIMRQSSHSAELLINHFLSNDKAKYHFPRSLLPSEYESIFEKYIDSVGANPNYVGLLSSSLSSRECPISDKLRLKAKHRHNRQVEDLFSRSPGISYGIEVSFSDTDECVKKEQSDDLTWKIKYSRKWITENLDYPTILNNFRYLFELVDRCWRCNLVSTGSQMSTLEKVFGVKGNKEYPTGALFHFWEMLSMAQIQGYCNLLKHNDISLEHVFQWFFQIYLKDEFGIDAYRFNPSSSGTTFMEKCRNICSEMDGVLKQYSLFLQDGYIDRELLEISSSHVVFPEVGSFFLDKYAYTNSDEIRRELFLLFSDQSMLSYTDKTKEQYDTFGELVESENVYIDDFPAFQAENIRWLIERGSAWEDDDRILHINNDRLFILKDLFDHEVICPYYYGRTRSIIDDLVHSGDLRFESTLFTIPEQAYLNYMLNKSEFSNGLDLRNKYIHSTNSQDEIQNLHDYYRLLIIMAIIILKLNEELIRKFPNNDVSDGQQSKSQ